MRLRLSFVLSLFACAYADGLPDPLLRLYETLPKPELSSGVPERPLNPDDPAWVLLDQAYAALREQDLSLAIRKFLPAIALQPERTDVRKDLAYTYLRVGENELARRQFAEVARLAPQDETSLLELAFLDYESQVIENRSEAWRIFRRLMETGSESTRQTARRAFENIDHTLATYIEAKLLVARVDSGNPFVAFELGIAFHERNAFLEAVIWYRRAVQAGQSQARLRLGEVLLRLERRQEAIDAFTTALDSGDGFVSEEARERLWQLQER